jgi:hypothetical protein
VHTHTGTAAFESGWRKSSSHLLVSTLIASSHTCTCCWLRQLTPKKLLRGGEVRQKNRGSVGHISLELTEVSRQTRMATAQQNGVRWGGGGDGGRGGREGVRERGQGRKGVRERGREGKGGRE